MSKHSISLVFKGILNKIKKNELRDFVSANTYNTIRTFFRNLSNKFSDLCPKNSGRVIKIAFYVSSWTVRGKLFFGKFLFSFGIWRKKFQLLEEIIPAMLSKRQKFLLENFSDEKLLSEFFPSFPDIERNKLRFFDGTFLAGLSKLISTCAEEQFGGETFLLKFKRPFSFFRHWAKIF